MNTKIKCLLLVMLFITTTVCYGQIRTADTNTVNAAPGSSAFIDASSSSAYNDPDDNLGKGLLFPRVDLTTFTAFGGVVGLGNSHPTFYDGFVVYNTASSGVAGVGETEGQLSPGFWYYDNSNPTGETNALKLVSGTWKPLGSGVAVADTPANGDVKYEGGGLKYWDVDQWKPLSGQGLVPPTHDPNVTVGLTGGKTEIMVGEIITLTSSEGVTWLLAQSDDYAELINGDSQLKGLAPGIVTVRATTADNRYNEFTVTVKSANNPDGSGNLNVGSNTYKTYEYSGVTWMVTNSKEGTSSAQKYNNDNSRVNGYYYTWAQAAGACPAGWRLPAQAEWNSLIAWINSNKTSEGAKFWITDAGSAFAGGYATGWDDWGTRGYWWGASSGLYGLGTTGGVSTSTSPTSYWFSVRCVKNNPL